MTNALRMHGGISSLSKDARRDGCAPVPRGGSKSPGGFPRGITIENVLNQQSPRNRAILAAA
jgi:hypothetical protein